MFETFCPAGVARNKPHQTQHLFNSKDKQSNVFISTELATELLSMQENQFDNLTILEKQLQSLKRFVLVQEKSVILTSPKQKLSSEIKHHLELLLSALRI